MKPAHNSTRTVVEAFVTVVTTQGDSTIVNSARNIELPELKSNAGLHERLRLLDSSQANHATAKPKYFVATTSDTEHYRLR